MIKQQIFTTDKIPQTCEEKGDGSYNTTSKENKNEIHIDIHTMGCFDENQKKNERKKNTRTSREVLPRNVYSYTDIPTRGASKDMCMWTSQLEGASEK
mmetsp:Transcript_64915/g.72721  ORF Transcript_64915/g.72721 Transcript_64915/m.72721 type:complete len:98 (+) Transcript_64915:600-893(+)